MVPALQGHPKGKREPWMIPIQRAGVRRHYQLAPGETALVPNAALLGQRPMVSPVVTGLQPDSNRCRHCRFFYYLNRLKHPLIEQFFLLLQQSVCISGSADRLMRGLQ